MDFSGPLSDLLQDTGIKPRHVLGSEKHLRKLQKDPRDWLFAASPHAGRFTVEVRVGVGIGDVDRHADVRVDLEDTVQTSDWFQEGPTNSARVRGGLYLGYAPTTYLDIGVLTGLQYGVRALTTGWAQISDSGTTVDSSGIQQVQAVQIYVQPRLRAYMVPVGPAKPYAFAGVELRIFDAYKIEQPDELQYPIPPAGLVAGPLGGLGLMIDPGPIVGFFAEGSFTYHLGVRSAAAEKGSWSGIVETVPMGVHYTIGVAGGVQFRL
ncbi:MAG: hypothetical protein HN348_13770 [Proteobacteria bacterium]|nr:hypothetical protein [Pseudomonadota bacterium]